jgi:tetratricopeptide (TPR) repeat protein
MFAPRCRSLLLAAFILAPASLRAAPPAWQQDLSALRLVESAASLAQGDDPARARKLAQLYRDLAAKYPDENAVQRACGDYFAQAGDRDAAVSYWRRAQALDPHDARSADSLGSIALAQTDVREATREFQLAVDAEPDNANYHFELANVLYLFRHQLADQNALSEALDHFRCASDLAPNDRRFALAYAETFDIFPAPDWDAALAAWQKVRTLSAPATDFADSHLARISLRLGRLEDARHYLDAIHDPKFDALRAKFLSQIAARQATPSPAP